MHVVQLSSNGRLCDPGQEEPKFEPTGIRGMGWTEFIYFLLQIWTTNAIECQKLLSPSLKRSLFLADLLQVLEPRTHTPRSEGGG